MSYKMVLSNCQYIYKTSITKAPAEHKFEWNKRLKRVKVITKYVNGS
jgi:hypothetical protein